MKQDDDGVISGTSLDLFLLSLYRARRRVCVLRQSECWDQRRGQVSGNSFSHSSSTSLSPDMVCVIVSPLDADGFAL